MQSLHDEADDSVRIIRRVVTVGCFVNALLMTLKLCAGYLGHSDALVADGFHSLNDVGADLIMFVLVGISYRSADRRYAYGYGKFATFSSLLMSAFLIVIAFVIAIGAIESIVEYSHGVLLPRPDIWTFIVVLFAMACKEGLYRYYYSTGKRTGSKALMANAWHHRSDALASIATLSGVTFSHFFGPAFRVLDPVASALIAIFIFVPALRLFISSFHEIMEHSLTPEEVDKAEQAVEKIQGVERVEYIRSRRNGHRVIFDIGVDVDPALNMRQADAIASEIKNSVRSAFCPHVIVNVELGIFSKNE